MADKRVTDSTEEGQDSKSQESLDTPQAELKQLLNERAALDTNLESKTKVKKFTLGDGGFAIQGVGDSSAEAKALAKHDFSQADTKAHIVRDELGYVTEATYPNGLNVKITYGGDMHDVTSLKYSDGHEWKKEGNQWMYVDNSGSHPQSPDADVRVTPKGDIVMKNVDTLRTKHPDGTEEIRYLQEQAVVYEDAYDRPIAIKYRDGTSNSIEYDKYDNPISITAGDRTQWKFGPNGWDCFDEHGKKIDHMAKFEVKLDGLIIATADDGTIYRRDIDGIRTEGKLGINSRNERGDITQITYADGRPRAFGYDADGNLNKFSDPWGEHRRDATTGKWAYFPKDGSNPMDEGGSYSFSNDGTLTYTRELGTIITYPDGSRLVADKDVPATFYDGTGEMTEIRYQDGRVTRIEYGKQGHCAKITQPDGLEFCREGNSWNVSKDGKVIEQLDGYVNIRWDGTIEGIGRDGKPRFTVASGQSTLSRPGEQRHF